MKKLLTILLLTASVSALAHGPHGHWRHGGGSSWYWVAPAVIGGVVGYEIARPSSPIIVQQTPPPMVYQQQNCSPWTQIQNPDGTITTTRTCYGVQ